MHTNEPDAFDSLACPQRHSVVRVMTFTRRRHAIALAMALPVLMSCGGGNGNNSWAVSPPVQPIPEEIAKIFQKPAYKNARWSLRVVDLDTGFVIHDDNAGKQMLIASVRKLFSVGLALEALGPNHALRTPVYRRGTVDAAGVLHGDLIVVASGDLAMGGRTNSDGSFAISSLDHNEANGLGNAALTAPDPLAEFNQLAAQVAALGIRQVTGELIIDDRLFEHFDFRDQFKVSPMFVNDDVVDVMIDRQAAVDWRPKSQAFTVQSSLVQVASGSELGIELESAQGLGRISGALPAGYVPTLGSYPLVRTFRITDPSSYARSVFIEALARAGVTAAAATVAPNPAGDLPAGPAYSDSTRVAELVSHPYKDQARYIMKVSYNIGAEVSLMLFGLTRGARAQAASLAVEASALAEQFGIPPAAVHFLDGSGDDETTATTEAVTTLLSGMRRRQSYPEFRDSLPAPGVDGSLAIATDFAADPALAGARGNVHAKTGTYVSGSKDGPVLRTESLAGYIDTKSGRHLAFMLAVNDVGVISGIEDILPVIQDVGTISALLWKLC
jgi:D-alanyl-D-alanine carboxypeptidase